MENNWKQKTLENLEKKIWPSINPAEESYLVKTCHSLRKKRIDDFSIEDLRLMIGQEIGLIFLIPKAIEVLTENLFAEGDMYEGDLLKNVLEINSKFWVDNPKYWEQINNLISDKRPEIKKMSLDTSKFDNYKG